MKRKLSYKTMVRWMIPALLVFCLIVYRFAISKTIRLWQWNSELSRQAEDQKNAPERIITLKEQIARFDKIIGTGTRDSIETRQEILEKTGLFCSRTGSCLYDFPDPAITEKPDFAIETNIIVLEGTFANLTRYIYETETLWRPGKLVSARFLIKNDFRTNTKTLNAYVYIQKIKKNKKQVIASFNGSTHIMFMRSRV